MHTYDTVFCVAVWSAFRCSFAASFLRKSNKLSCKMLTAYASRQQRVVPSLKVYVSLTVSYLHPYQATPQEAAISSCTMQFLANSHHPH